MEVDALMPRGANRGLSILSAEVPRYRILMAEGDKVYEY